MSVIDAVLKMLIENLLPHLGELLLAALVAAMSFGLLQLRKLPKLLRNFADDLAEKASKTPDPKDDVVAKILAELADSLSKALDKVLGPVKQ